MTKHLMARELFVKRGRKYHLCWFCLPLFFTMCASVFAQQSASDVKRESIVARYPSGSIKSVEEADMALAAANQERAEIEARYNVEEQSCHTKFFATSCIDAAKERRRKELMQVRSIEIEANTYKRQARVAARDRALADRQAKEAADRQGRQSE